MSYSYGPQSSLDTTAVRLGDFSPWRIFSKVWSSAMGYPADKLDITPGAIPLLTLKETSAFLLSYYVIILGGREFMRSRPAFKLNDLFLIHNFYLTAISGGLLVLFVEQLVPTLWKDGLFSTICGDGGWSGPLVTLYYLNYLTKYLELLDTVFLVLKKKPLTFLHCYHHGATAFLCYTQLIGHTPVSWVPITLNLTVHVVMYWYYFQSARGIRIWWKEWITRLQIAQFIIDLGFVYYATYNYYASAYLPMLPHVGTCGGEEFAAFTGCATLSSYLVLFISFYAATYKKASRKEKRSTKAISTSIPKAAVRELETKSMPTVQQTTDTATEALHAAEDLMKAAGTTMVHDLHLSGNGND
ncbi:Fatty acyl-CoA elongase/Polyunsaturated fatty acid specific elongation enzyme [Lecanora helva]